MNRRILLLLVVVLSVFVIVLGIIAGYLIANPSRGIVGGTPTVGPVTKSASTTVVAGKTCGVTKTSTGYTFSWLHVANGSIVDENNCIVNLRGFNLGGLGEGNAFKETSPALVKWLNQTFQMNLVRVNFNSTWWDDNVYVPDAKMHYRDVLQQFVKTLEENGDYVQLDRGPQFAQPPCGGGNTNCPTQNTGRKDLNANPNAPSSQQEQTSYLPPALSAWTDLAKLYANDPAVIYDAWNEPTTKLGISAQTYYQDMNTLINTIRAQNPRSLIIVYSLDWNKIMSGSVPNYSQSNLVIDWHVYDGYTGTVGGKSCSEPDSKEWRNWQTTFPNEVAYAQNHGQGVIINEWGGCYDLPAYNQAITSFAQAKHVALTYFEAANVFTKTNGSYQLNANGALVQSSYANW